MAEKRVQRRLAAILVADVVGYSRLMHTDEEGTLAQVKAYRKELFEPTVAKFGGRLVKSTGDGVLIEFPSAVDAVRNAVTIQRALSKRNSDIPDDRRIVLRIGVNFGDLIVDGDDIFGDGVNVAARLEALAEPGGISISGTVYEHVHGKVDVNYLDAGEQSLKNISEPVRMYRISPGDRDDAVDEATSATAITDFVQRPSLAVLPFNNLSSDPEQEFFADGHTEDLITNLTLWRSFPEIARKSTFVYKGKAVNVKDVGDELGARYVLEGSVRISGNRVRVTAQLIDAETGHHVWAETFNRQLEDIFDLQDELTRQIAAIVAPELERAETSRSTAKKPLSLGAWDCVQRGSALLDKYSKEGNEQAREMFARALEIDPAYGQALAGLALSYNRDLMMGYAESRDAATQNALETARQAVTLDKSDAFAHSVLGMALVWADQEDDAILSLRRSVELNPSNGYALASLGTILDLVGETDEGISIMEDGLRLNPHAPNVNHVNSFLARAHLTARHYETALEWARKAIHEQPDYPNPHFMRAIILGHLGRIDEARAALEQCERLQPGFVAQRANWRPYRNPEANEHLHDGLRKIQFEN